MDSKTLTSSSINDNEDFVSSEKTKDLHKVRRDLSISNSLEHFCKLFAIFKCAERFLLCFSLQKLLVEASKTDHKLPPVHCIGIARCGNGARRNWNCDHLLKEFTAAAKVSENLANSYHGINLNLVINETVLHFGDYKNI